MVVKQPVYESFGSGEIAPVDQKSQDHCARLCRQQA